MKQSVITLSAFAADLVLGTTICAAAERSIETLYLEWTRSCVES